ncbi:4Fe-4S binding protein [Enterocloster citroniae]
MTIQIPVWANNCTHCMACISRCPTTTLTNKKFKIN